MFSTVLLDVDGTLIDSNDAHAASWVEAFAEQNIKVDYNEVRKRIGMGGDNLMPEVAGLTEESPIGKKASERRGEIFRAKYLPNLHPFPGTRELIQRLIDSGLELIVATSAPEEDLKGLLKQAQVDDLLIKATSADDAENSKPEPDIIQAALQKTKSPKSKVVMIGDTPYDIQAAKKAGIPTIAFTSGGWTDSSLSDAIKIYQGPWDLLSNFATSPFARSENMSLSF